MIECKRMLLNPINKTSLTIKSSADDDAKKNNTTHEMKRKLKINSE